MAKPGLDIWKENQILEAAWIQEAPPAESIEDIGDARFRAWKAEVKKLSNERSLKARDRGCQIHDAIEAYIKRNKFDPELEKYVEAVESAVKEALGLWISTLEAETTFSSPLGYGGMIDGLSRSDGLLIDWKTKSEPFTEKTKLAYPEHAMQLVAYREGVGLHNAVCVNVFIGPDTEIRVHIWDESDLIIAWEKFQACLILWKLDRKYDSSFTEISQKTV